MVTWFFFSAKGNVLGVFVHVQALDFRILGCYLAGSLDFNFLVEIKEVFHETQKQVELFAEGSTATKY